MNFPKIKRKSVSIVISLITCYLLLLLGCDRFTRSFEATVTEQQEIERFIYSFTSFGSLFLQENDIDSFMYYFAPDYLNDGADWDDVKTMIQSVNWEDGAEVVVTHISRYEYRIALINRTVDEIYGASGDDGALSLHYGDGVSYPWSHIPYSSTLEWTDYVGRRGDRTFLWVGNRHNPNDDFERVILAQAFTSLDCVNCPNSQRKLHQLEAMYPDNFIFMEYYLRQNPVIDSLHLYNQFQAERTYYGGINSAPVAIFAGLGNIRVSGGNEAQLAQYETIVADLVNTETPLSFSNLQKSVSDRTITGSVELNWAGMPMDNLWLHYAVYEAETTAINIHSQEPATHVVRGRGSHLLGNFASGETVEFTLLSERHLDTDTYLVLWVQKMDNPASYSEGDMILNAVKTALF